MNTSRSFKFHSFSDYPTNNTSLEISRYFFKSMDNNLLSNNFEEDENKEKKEKKNIPNYFLTTNLSYDFSNKNKELINNNEFPVKEIINSDFEKILKLNGTSKVKNYLEIMTYQNLNNNFNLNSKNNFQLILLLKQFQQILQYLLDSEKKITQFNNSLNQSEKEIYIEKEQLINNELKINKILEENENKIIKLENQINIYKKIILTATEGIQSKPLVYNVLDIHDDDNNYYCDICPNKIFKSYQDVQIHYIDEHRKILKIREKNCRNLNYISINNINYEQFYFDSKLNNVKNEIQFLLYESNANKKKDYNNILNESKNNFNLSQKNLNNNINQNEFDMQDFENKLKYFENLQKKHNDNLKKSFSNFQNEIFSQLKNIKNNKPIIISNIIQDDIKNDINYNLKKDVIQYNINYKINNDINYNIKNDLNNKNKDCNNNKNINNLGQSYFLQDSINDEVNIKNNYINYINNNNINNNNLNNNKFEEKYINTNIISNEKGEINNNINKNNEKNINLINILNDIEKDEKKEEINSNNMKEENNINLKMNNINNKNYTIIKNFAENFFERENKILFGKTHYKIKDLADNYKILNNQNKENNINKTSQLIEELNNKYDLNDRNKKAKEQYRKIINDIYKNNNLANNLIQNAHHNYFNNLLEKMDLKKYLDNNIV